MISYAQNLEDVILARCFPDRRSGFYIDVGAGDPVEDSVTKHFYDLGWSGINIDPHREKFSSLAAARPRDINLQLAVSHAAGTATFFELATWGLSSLKAEAKALADHLGEAFKAYEVNTRTLAEICEQHVGARTIDFLKIDVEGAERDVIAGMNFEKYPASIVVVEATHPNTQIATHLEWEDLLLKAGYLFVYFDGLNRFYLHHNMEHLRIHLSIPPNVFDNYKRLAEVGAGAIQSLTYRALTQAVETERAAKSALGQTVERMRAENAAMAQALEQEAKKSAASPRVMEDERLKRRDIFRLWNTASEQKKTTDRSRRVSLARKLLRRVLHRLTRASPRWRAVLQTLERHLGRDGAEILYGVSFETLNTKDLRWIVTSAFWRDVVMPLDAKGKSNGLFDSVYYCATYPELEQWRSAPLRHYILQGAGEGRNPHLLFDTFWYLRNSPDIALCGQNPLFHFANCGGLEGRDPHPLFDSSWYLKNNVDVARAGANPLMHYLRTARVERRNPHPLFDTAWYLEHNPAAVASGANPLEHFVAIGAAARRDPAPLFNVAWYLEKYPDVAAAGVNPLIHFLVEGSTGGYDPNPFFGSRSYLTENLDVARLGENPLIHYVLLGASRGYNPSPRFDTGWYLGRYPDIAKGGWNPLSHYLAFGRAEGRHPHPSYERADDVKNPSTLHTAGVGDTLSRYHIRDFSVGPIGTDTNTKPLIVCVSHVFPWPPRAGNEYRIARILDWLTKLGHELLVVIAPLGNDEPSEKQRSDVFGKYPNVVICYDDGRLLTSFKSRVFSLDSIKNRPVSNVFNDLKSSSRTHTAQTMEVERQWCHAALIGVLAEIREQSDDLIYYINYAFMTRFLGYLRRPARSFVDTHDIFSQKQEKVASFGVRGGVELSKDEEAKMLRRADAIVAIHRGDAHALTRLLPGKTVISAGVDFTLVDVGAPSSRPNILLVAFNNALNVKGVNDFLRFAWPMIKRAVPQAEFVVVGRVGEAVHSNDPQVRITGVVNSLEPYYRDARVVVNPAVAGTGLKIKTVESVAYLRPIVTWPHGVDGIGDPVLKLCRVAHSWYEFAQKTIALLSVGKERLPSVDREAIERELQADVVYAELGAWLNQLH